MSNSLQPHGLQHTMLPCPSLFPGVCSNPCPLSQWCYITVWSSAVLLPLYFLHLPSIFTNIRVFLNESTLCIRWPKYWSFSINVSNEYSELISFRIDSFDLLAVQGTFKSLFQQHNLKASILQCSAFFIVLFSYPSLTMWTFVSKAMSLLTKV